MDQTVTRLPEPQARQRIVLSCPCDEILFGGSAGAGKALALDTPILTPHQGWRTMADLQVGDFVFGSDGKPARIHTVSPVMHGHDVYAVIFDDGSIIKADAEHLWFTFTELDRNRAMKQLPEVRAKRRANRHSRGTGKRPDLAQRNTEWAAVSDKPFGAVRTTIEILATIKGSGSIRANHSIPLADPVVFFQDDPFIPIAPYVLGAWLGDGTSSAPYITCADHQIIQNIERHYPCKKLTAKYNWRIDLPKGSLRKLNVFENKHIPEVYKRLPVAQRMDLLRGLMDTDGTCSNRGLPSFSNCNETLARDVLELVLGLGFKATMTSKIAKINGRPCGIAYNVSFNTCLPVFSLARKLARLKPKMRQVSAQRYIVDVVKLESEPVKCIGVESANRLYLAGPNLVPTHNSWTLLADYCHHGISAENDGKTSSGVLFRRTFRELEELVREGRDMYDTLGWKFWKDRMQWESPHGSILKLAFLASMEDAYAHRGFEYDWEGFDELTLWPTSDEYSYLGSRLRSSQGVRTRRLSTSNPDGPGHSWVKRHFQIDRYPQGMTPLVEQIKLADGRVIEKSRIFIPGKLKDNIYLAADGHYEAELRTRPPHIQKMLLDGRWDVVEGAFFHEWNPDFHVIDPFIIPEEWTRWMAMDWGSVHPYAILWFAISPSGEIYIYRELYGDGSAMFPGKSNVGTRETAQQVAKRIVQLEEMANESILERYADSQVWQQMGNQTTIGDEFRTGGVVFQSAAKLNKAHSVNLLRQAMQITNGMCQLKIFRSCTHIIRQIPAATISPSDANVYEPKGETHALDAILYGLRKNNSAETLKHADLVAKLNARRAAAYGKYGVQ